MLLFETQALDPVTRAPDPAFTYNISPNGAAGDWYWEVTCGGDIVARGSRRHAGASPRGGRHLCPRTSHAGRAVSRSRLGMRAPGMAWPLFACPKTNPALLERIQCGTTWATGRPRRVLAHERG